MAINVPQIGLDDYKRYPEGLTENDLFRFDTTQDNELEPQDFTDGNQWKEFACKYARSHKSLREVYRGQTSRNLEIELSWQLFCLWQSDGLTADEKKILADILRRDFKVHVDETTDRESVVRQFLSISTFTGTSGGVEYEKEDELDEESEVVTHTKGWSVNAGAYAGAAYPLRLLDDRLLLNLKPEGNAYYVNGERTIENEDEGLEMQPFQYASLKAAGSITLSDLADEQWYVIAGGLYRYRTVELKGFTKSDYAANLDAGIDYLFGIPLDLSVSGGIEAASFTPPLLDYHNHQSTLHYNADSSLSYNLASQWALAGSYTYKFRDDAEKTEKKKSEEHQGSLYFDHRRSLDDSVSAGVSLSHVDQEKSQGDNKSQNKDFAASAWAEYFTFLGSDEHGTDQVLTTRLSLSANKRKGDFEGWFPGVSASFSGSAYLVKDVLEAKLSLDGEFDYINKETPEQRFDFETSYAIESGLVFYIVKDFIDLRLGGSFAHEFELGGLNYSDMSGAGEAELTFSFDVLNGLELLVKGYGGKSQKRNLETEKVTLDNFNFGAEVDLGINF
ncbi:MAG: hypothetical protein HQM16_01815 [Deltaproteobacteria bacterium]|nr:hypothetical protein [Deltaproteobacteria bacterium]